MKTRRFLLFAVMLGALSLSFNGQVSSVTVLLGQAFAVVFALTFDVASLLALHEVTNGDASRRVRRWAWLVLLQAGGTALGLNTWHALSTHTLPDLAAVAVGAGPVVLAWSLSHLIALVLTDKARADQTGRPAGTAPAGASRTAPATAGYPVPAGWSAPVAGISTRFLEPAGTPSASGVTGSWVSEAAGLGSDSSGGDALVEQAARLERQALAESGGARGISYREAARRLRVRYPTARAALDAARSRTDRDRVPPPGSLDSSDLANPFQSGSHPAA